MFTKDDLMNGVAIPDIIGTAGNEIKFEIYKVIQKLDNGLIVEYEPIIYRALLEEHFPGEFKEFKDKVLFSAAFEFVRLAMYSFDKLERAEVMEDETDPTASLRTQAESVQHRYGVDDLNDMMRFMPQVYRIAVARKFYWDDRFSAWLASGGHSYNEVTRNEKALGQH